MFDHIFENRDRKITDLLRLGDCLGRSLRENVSLFSVDDQNSRVSYLTEGQKIISGDYNLKDGVELDFIVVENFDMYTDETKFDSFVDSKVSIFVESLYSDNFGKAQTNFSDILNTWNSRLKFDSVKARLHEKNSKFNDSQDILSTPQFHNFIELSDQISGFLEENYEEILNIPEIMNGIRLSNTVTKAFNLPRLNYTTLAEQGSYRVSDLENKSIYEMICRQELVKKELLESKKQFLNSWASSKSVKSLAGLIYEENQETVMDALSMAIEEIPYFAFVTKKDLYESVRNALSISESVEIPDEHIRKFTSTLFEYKKPVKIELIKVLNEKYGINIQNLKDTPTFKSLTNTQVVVLESMARISPKSSTQKQVLREFANLLQTKSGVQSLDVNDCLRLIFEAAGFGDMFEGEELINHWDGDLSNDVETNNMYKGVVEYTEEEALEEQDGEEDPEEGEPEKPDPLEQDPEDKEDEEQEKKEEADDLPDKEVSKEDFMEAMSDLEDILGDINQEADREDGEDN